MNEIGIIILILLTGFILGVFFFGTLWWTTNRGVVSKLPALWFLGSFFIRMSITVTVLYFISRRHWESVLVCLLGFIIARVMIMRFTRRSEINQNQ